VKFMNFDDQDKAALRSLGEFTIDDDGNGETATIEGEMKVEFLRSDSGAIWVSITLPRGGTLQVTMKRWQFLEAGGIDEDEDEVEPAA
jgi:hypothetical protein